MGSRAGESQIAMKITDYGIYLHVLNSHKRPLRTSVPRAEAITIKVCSTDLFERFLRGFNAVFILTKHIANMNARYSKRFFGEWILTDGTVVIQGYNNVQWSVPNATQRTIAELSQHWFAYNRLTYRAL